MDNDLIFFEKEIKRIKKMYGKSIFSKSNFHSVLKDLSPEIKNKFLIIFKIANDLNIYEKIHCFDEIRIEGLKKIFIQECGLDPLIASAIWWSYFYGNEILSTDLLFFLQSDKLLSHSLKEKYSKGHYTFENKNYLNKNYDTIIIGNQEWMTSNLSVTTFLNGELIPLIKSYKEWENVGIEEKPAFCYYENNEENLEQFGVLYNWWAIKDERKICPIGFKIPSKEDFEELKRYVKGNSKTLKSNSKWNGINETLFDALPSGFREKDGNFNEMKSSFYLWTSTCISNRSANYLKLWSSISSISISTEKKSCGLSLRCLKE